jgi:hypothetical protein
MRVFFGMILGIALTVGVAFVHDTWAVGPATTTGSAATTPDTPPGIASRSMVNWDVVGKNLRVVRERAREAWTALSQKVTS